MAMDRECLVCREYVREGAGCLVSEERTAGADELAIVCRPCNVNLVVGVSRRVVKHGRDVVVRRFNYRNREG
jgi:hypothetical protein